MSELIDNYIYLYHTDEWLILPTYPDTINDNLSSTFATTNALSRTAPIYTYSYSGPREVQITLDLHRDMMWDMNYKASNVKVEIGDDYVDTLIKKLQAIALPRYSPTTIPPMVAVRFGETLFIKGVVNGGITVDYQKPIMSDNKYAKAVVTFKVSEVQPYDAESVETLGSFRGITAQFKNGIWK